MQLHSYNGATTCKCGANVHKPLQSLKISGKYVMWISNVVQYVGMGAWELKIRAIQKVDIDLKNKTFA